MYRQTRFTRATHRVMLLCTFLLVAAAAFCGMFSKHGFDDGNRGTSLTAILDGTASRPYVYRQLLPVIANTSAALLPAAVKNRFLAHLQQDAPAHNPLRATFVLATRAADPALALRYYIVYGLSFCALLTAMLMLRQVCLELSGDEVAATLAPLVLAIAVPASYFYDFPELLFMTLAVWLACRAKWGWLVPLAIVATFNKESFPVFALTLYPFLRLRMSRRAAAMCVSACVVAGALVNVLVKYRYAGNDGGPVIFNLWFNLQFFANPRNYFLSEWTYGLPLPRATNVAVLAVLAILVRAGWGALPDCVRRHALLAAAFNVPLFLAFGFIDEVRALSMLDVSATLVLCTVASRYLVRATGAERVMPPRAAVAHEAPAVAGGALAGAQAAANGA
jgi:hypothetical protein